MNDVRYRGYQADVHNAGIELDPRLVVGGTTDKHRGYSEEFGYEAMNKLLDTDPGVTAVFACSDVQALGAWRAIMDRGKSVPGEIALVGYDNLKRSHYWGLSTVDQHMGEIGENATRRLLRLMRGETFEDLLNVVVKPDLVVRRSIVG